jgi:hypothetical protein
VWSPCMCVSPFMRASLCMCGHLACVHGKNYSSIGNESFSYQHCQVHYDSFMHRCSCVHKANATYTAGVADKSALQEYIRLPIFTHHQLYSHLLDVHVLSRPR